MQIFPLLLSASSASWWHSLQPDEFPELASGAGGGPPPSLHALAARTATQTDTPLPSDAPHPVCPPCSPRSSSLALPRACSWGSRLRHRWVRAARSLQLTPACSEGQGGGGVPSPSLHFWLHNTATLGKVSPARLSTPEPFTSVASLKWPVLLIWHCRARLFTPRNFRLGSWLSYSNNGRSICIPRLRRKPQQEQQWEPRSQRRLPCTPPEGRQATSHASSLPLEQYLKLLEQIKPKKGNTVKT